MNLHTLIARYIALHQASGKPFVDNAQRLRSFARTFGPDADITAVTPEHVNTFLTGGGPLTRNYHVKYSIVRGFFRYARSRGCIDTAPLPASIPKPPPPFRPYIYSREELGRLVRAVDSGRRRRDCRLEPVTMRAILLLLYGTGLRLGEALALNRPDVDRENALLTVHVGKCFKSRLVPLGATLNQALADYATRPTRHAVDQQTPFFTTRAGGRVRPQRVQDYFRRVCERAGVRREDGGRFQPRLHDLRHTFAVHRLTSWYRQGADVQALLPHLCTYLGHTNLAATQVYLSMTPELLQEAGHRFQHYAFAESPRD